MGIFQVILRDKRMQGNGTLFFCMSLSLNLALWFQRLVEYSICQGILKLFLMAHSGSTPYLVIFYVFNFSNLSPVCILQIFF